MPALALYALIGAAVFCAGGGAAAVYYRGEIAQMKLEHQTALTNGYQAAMKVTHELQASADAVRSQPVKRVLCRASPAPVPGGGAGADVGDLPDSGTGGGPDYGPAMREFLAAAIANRKLSGLQTK